VGKGSCSAQVGRPPEISRKKPQQQIGQLPSQ